MPESPVKKKNNSDKGSGMSPRNPLYDLTLIMHPDYNTARDSTGPFRTHLPPNARKPHNSP